MTVTGSREALNELSKYVAACRQYEMDSEVRDTILKTVLAIKSALSPDPAGETLTDAREAFENWLRIRWPNPIRPIDEKTSGGAYIFSENNILWEAWQAATLAATNALLAIGVNDIAEIIMRDIPLDWQSRAEVPKASLAILSLIQSKIVQPRIATKPATSGTAAPVCELGGAE